MHDNDTKYSLGIITPAHFASWARSSEIARSVVE